MGIRVFGALRIEGPDGELVIRGARERQILALLVARRGRVVADDVLIDEFWGGDADPGAARRSLRVRISHLRRALTAVDAIIEHTGSGYRLSCAPSLVDAERFRELVAGAEVLPVAARVEACDAALREWTDAPFAEFTYLDAFAAVRSDLVALRRRSVVMRAAALIACGRSGDAVDGLRPELAESPEDEELTRVAMRGLAAAGRPAEALSVYAGLADALAERGLDPSPPTVALEEDILVGRPLPPPDSPPVPSLPPPIPRWEHPVGRDEDIERAVRIAATERLVTVHGPAGVGKTRVAAAVAAHLAATFPAGVFWVALADTVSRTDVEHEISVALGLRTQKGVTLHDSLSTRLGRRRGLVVLDNAEHVGGDVVDILEPLLLHCPGLHVLVTSQIAVGLPGETRIRLAPLAVPPPGAGEDDVTASPAVELFHRAAARSGVTAPVDDAAVARLVTRLDGLPLAIELAAARTQMLTPDEIAQRVGERLTLLDAPGSRGRSDSVEAAVQWSIGLLEEDDRRMLARLTVFAGGFSVDAAEAVAGADEVSPGETTERLARLVDRSLVEVSTLAGRRRLHVLAAVRSVASRLEADLTGAQLAHARWYAGLLDEIAAAPSAQRVDRIVADLHQILPAFDRAVRIDHRLSLGMAAATAWYWPRHGDWEVGMRWYDEVLAGPLPDDPDLVMPILQAAAVLALFGRSKPERAEELFARQDAMAVRHDRPRPFNAMSLVASYRGDYPTAIDLLRRQVEQDRSLERSADVALANLAHLHTEMGDLETARIEVEEAIAESRRFETDLISHADLVKAQIAWQSGDLPEARRIAGEVLDRWTAGAVNIEHQASILHLLSQVEIAAGDLPAASARLDEAGARLVTIGRDVAHHLLLTAAIVRTCGDAATAADLTRAALDRLGDGETLFPTRQSLVGQASPTVPQRTLPELVRWSAASRRAVIGR